MNREEFELLRQKAQKDFDTTAARLLMRPLSIRITRILIQTPITANQVTLFSFLLKFMAAFLFLSTEYVLTLTAGIFVYVSHVLDCVDGEIARAKNLESSSGALLDYFLDRLSDIAIYSGVAFGLFLSRNDPAVLALGIFVVGSNLFMTDVAQKIDKLKGEKHIRRKSRIYEYFYYGGSANTIVLLVASIVGRLFEGMAIIGILSFSYTIARFAEAYIALRT